MMPGFARRDVTILFVGALILRALTALFLQRPGYMDAAYYVDGALSLYEGRGFSEPFIWNYLDNPVSIPHPSHLYWMPLSSILAYLSFLLFGPTYRAAQVPFGLLSALLPVLSYLVVYDVAQDRRHALCASAFAAFSGFYTAYWVTPDAFAPFAFAGALCLWALGRGLADGKPTWFAIAGLGAGFAHLARADGLLLAGVALLTGVLQVIILLGMSRRLQVARTILCYLLFAIFYLLVMAPWFVRNIRVIGRPLSAAGVQTMWLTDYDDLYSYGKPLTMRSYLAWGWGNILKSKIEALWLNAQTLLFVGWMIFLAPLGLVGLWRLRRRVEFHPALLYGALLYLVMSLVFTFPGWRGGMLHSVTALLPTLYAIAMEGLDTFIVWVAHRRRTWQPRQAQRALSIGLVGFAALLSAVLYAKGLDKFRGEHLYGEVAAWMHEHVPSAGRVMVNDPASFYYHSRRQCLSIPNAEVDTVLDVMARYGADYLLLDGNYVPLRALYESPRDDDRVTLLRAFTRDGETLYLFRLELPGP
jgi:hypothetical protein